MGYTQPLRRRAEGISWVFFGLASALFAFSYAWLYQNGYDPTFRLMAVWLIGYALFGAGPALLVWRLADVMEPGQAIDGKRVAASIAVLATTLVAANWALWHVLGETQLTVALNISIFGLAPWVGLALVQWPRLSTNGRRDTVLLGAAMALLGFVLVFALDAGVTTVNKDILVFVASNGAIPLFAGLWRLAKG